MAYIHELSHRTSFLLLYPLTLSSSSSTLTSVESFIPLPFPRATAVQPRARPRDPEPELSDYLNMEDYITTCPITSIQVHPPFNSVRPHRVGREELCRLYGQLMEWKYVCIVCSVILSNNVCTERIFFSFLLSFWTCTLDVLNLVHIFFLGERDTFLYKDTFFFFLLFMKYWKWESGAAYMTWYSIYPVNCSSMWFHYAGHYIQ